MPFKTGINVLFVASERATVKSGRSSANVPLREFALSYSLKRVSIPAVNQRVFKKLVTKNTSGHQLLAGQVHIFHKGVFLGISHLEHRSQDEEMNLSLGRDDRIKIRRFVNNKRSKTFEKGTSQSFLGD